MEANNEFDMNDIEVEDITVTRVLMQGGIKSQGQLHLNTQYTTKDGKRPARDISTRNSNAIAPDDDGLDRVLMKKQKFRIEEGREIQYSHH